MHGDLQAGSSGWLLEVTTCMGRRHFVAASLQAAQLVKTLLRDCTASAIKIGSLKANRLDSTVT